MTEIIRSLPCKRYTHTVYTQKQFEEYNRYNNNDIILYTNDDFARFNYISNAIEKYELWKNGRNYVSNRKIVIGGKIHKKLGRENDIVNIEMLTIEHNQLINSYKIACEKLNNASVKYNIQCDEIIKEINVLDDWNEFVLFNGKKYGVQCIKNGIHMRNNCGGTIEMYNEPCTCSTCENWLHGCDQTPKKQYKCSNNCKFI